MLTYTNLAKRDVGSLYVYKEQKLALCNKQRLFVWKKPELIRE